MDKDLACILQQSINKNNFFSKLMVRGGVQHFSSSQTTQNKGTVNTIFQVFIYIQSNDMSDIQLYSSNFCLIRNESKYSFF